MSRKSNEFVPRKPWRCPHCHNSRSKPESCVKCTREMCDDCISFDSDYGVVCGLCKDQIVARRKWESLGSPGDFDEWYDKNG